jgi:hypothetical protein
MDENVLTVVLLKRLSGEEMDQANTCAMRVACITK